MIHLDLRIACLNKRKLRNNLKLLGLIICFSFMQLRASALAVYMEDVDPWGYTQNQSCMNNVFGVGGWSQFDYSTPAAGIFTPATSFVMMEGGDANSGFPAYLSANQVTIENWVAAGGRLFINAAPNYGSAQNWGFGGTILMYPGSANNVTTSVPGNPIFLGPYSPTVTSYTGSAFAHAWINGAGMTSLLYNSNAAPDAEPVLAYKAWGTGIVFFGGCTQPNFWTPYTEGVNLWQNIFVLATGGSPAVNVAISCPNNVTACTSVVNDIAPTVTNGNCALVTYSMAGATTGSGLNDASGTNFNVGTTIVKYLATNTCLGPSDSCSFSVTINPPTGSLAGNTLTPESVNVNVVGPVDVRYTDCDLMAGIIPAGVDPIHGNTTVKVTIDNVTNNFNGQPYLRRHFDIEPGTSANSATAVLRINAYQYEFDAYNLAAGPAGLPLLPTNGIDNGNVKITQFHGVGTAPGNYPGNEELIVPAVSWDSIYNNWVMTFDVTGFSGFYIHTGFGSGPLAIQIRDIKAVNKDTRNRVDWSTATETKGDVMTLERSIDGISFTSLTDVYATGKTSTYTYWDEKPATGINYYRVKFTDNARRVTYTNVVNATVKVSSGLTITASPNPVLNVVSVNVTGNTASNGKLLVTDPTGKTLMQTAINGNSKALDLSSFPSGIYFVKYTDDSGSVTTRVNKQ